jgi:hypothetical protein
VRVLAYYKLCNTSTPPADRSHIQINARIPVVYRKSTSCQSKKQTALLRSFLATGPALLVSQMADAGGVGPSAEALAAATAAPVAFAKRKSRGNIRKRPDADSEALQEPDSSVVQKAKQQRGAPLAFSTKKDEKDAVTLRYDSNRALPAQVDNSATRALETETLYDRDSRYAHCLQRGSPIAQPCMSWCSWNSPALGLYSPVPRALALHWPRTGDVRPLAPAHSPRLSSPLFPKGPAPTLYHPGYHVPAP